MCYPSPVMLRGRRSCAISERPTPLPFAVPSLFRMLSPTIPVHPRNSPVSPIIPVHTQKQGGGACGSYQRPETSDQKERRKHITGIIQFSEVETGWGKSGPPRKAAPTRTLNRLSPLTPLISAPLATPALRVVPAPTFTTTSSIHVGAPTILFRERTTASKQFPDRRALFFPNCALLTVARELLFSPKSNHSRTYAPFARKSNYSRTYAKQGGGVGYLNGNVPNICRRADIFVPARGNHTRRRSPGAQARMPVPPKEGGTQEPV